MQREIFVGPSFQWIDVVDPTTEELQEIARVHELHPLFVQDCLDPEHLAKIEEVEGALFLILRVYDVEAPADAATVQELTRKVAIFVRGSVLLTIHRVKLPFLETMIQELEQKEKTKNLSLTSFLITLCKNGIIGYEKLLENAEREVDRLEAQIYSRKSSSRTLLELHLVRLRLTCVKRLFWHSLTIVQRLPRLKKDEVLYHDLRETVDSLMFFSDELLEDATSLMNLDLSIAGQKTNEVIRVLTLFSVFFMPLTFIVGVYGMNFEYMPELKWPLGYPLIWLVMAAITVIIALWFKKRGWL